jgi:purine-binding chemotaxis protein CheW
VGDTTAGFVLFRVAAENYGLPIERVQSIIRYERGTPVPKAPDVVQGVINLRGRIIPVVDLPARLGRGTFVPEATSRIVVAEAEAGVVGLAVDAASEVVHLDPETIQPPPEAAMNPDAVDAIAGVAEYQGALVIILDLDRAVPRTDYASTLQAETSEKGQEDG